MMQIPTNDIQICSDLLRKLTDDFNNYRLNENFEKIWVEASNIAKQLNTKWTFAPIATARRRKKPELSVYVICDETPMDPKTLKSNS